MADMELTDLKATETKRKYRTSFYGNAAEYWSSIPATVDGVLGGFGFISQTDIKGSLSFLRQLFKVCISLFHFNGNFVFQSTVSFSLYSVELVKILVQIKYMMFTSLVISPLKYRNGC